MLIHGSVKLSRKLGKEINFKRKEYTFGLKEKSLEKKENKLNKKELKDSKKILKTLHIALKDTVSSEKEVKEGKYDRFLKDSKKAIKKLNRFRKQCEKLMKELHREIKNLKKEYTLVYREKTEDEKSIIQLKKDKKSIENTLNANQSNIYNYRKMSKKELIDIVRLITEINDQLKLSYAEIRKVAKIRYLAIKLEKMYEEVIQFRNREKILSFLNYIKKMKRVWDVYKIK